MPRKLPPGPSRLSQILKHLQKEPIPNLPALRSLRLTYAFRNDHFGARYFVKEDLPRIAYANPSLNIVVNKVAKKIEDILTPEMTLEFHDGSQHTINMEKKLSSVIFTELLDLHGKRGKNIRVQASNKAGSEQEQRSKGEKTVPLNLAAESRRTSPNTLGSP